MKVIIVGNIACGKSTIAEMLARQLCMELIRIDQYRQKYGDGTPAGDHRAKLHMRGDIMNKKPQVIELLGTGGTALGVWNSLLSGSAIVVGIHAGRHTCRLRYLSRPAHSFPMPAQKITVLGIIRSYSYSQLPKLWSPHPYYQVNNHGGADPQRAVNEIKEIITQWTTQS
jgi:hypothetical protein